MAWEIIYKQVNKEQMFYIGMNDEDIAKLKYLIEFGQSQ